MRSNVAWALDSRTQRRPVCGAQGTEALGHCVLEAAPEIRERALPSRDTEDELTDDIVRGWAPVYPHIRYQEPSEAIAWLTSVFGFRERVRMTRPDGTVITSKLESPAGGLVMVVGTSSDFTEWIRERVPDFREQQERPWPNLSHTTTVMVSDVDAHYERAKAAGATILMAPTDQPWALRSYATLDLEGHQWEFSQTLGIVEPEAWGATRIE